VLLAVTGAPSQTVSYASTFTTTDDGWTGSASATVLNATEGSPGSTSAILRTGISFSQVYSRTVTGLTIGNVYTFAFIATRMPGPPNHKITLGVTGIGSGAAFLPPLGVRTPLSYTFTATATSHVITITTNTGTTIFTHNGYTIDSVLVWKVTGWLGTTITRTDANGTARVVREALGGQDTSGTAGSATMSVTDYEAALLGTVSYTVTDGTGGTATTSITPPAGAGVWLALPGTSNPGAPTPPQFVPVVMVTGYNEDSPSNGALHTIIGREDPIANPGPLGLRSGTVDLWCLDYASAKAVRTLLSGGLVAQLRQPSFPGMDCYLVASGGVSIRYDNISTPQRWVATVAYQEVSVP